MDYGRLWAADMTHPLEKKTALEFQKNGVVDWVAREVGSVKMRTTSRAEANIRSYPVKATTQGRLHGLYKTALTRLGCNQEYPLFVTFGYDLTAQTSGSRRDGYTITVNSLCLEAYTDEELTALLGHELGHILGDHVQNLELLRVAETLAQSVPAVGTLVGKQIWTYFAKWMIASEYTADRAALFACGSLPAVLSMLFKQMGYDPSKPGLRSILDMPVRETPEKLGVYFIWLAQSMPAFGGVRRAQELAHWVLSPAFQKEYPALHYCARVECDDPAASNTDRQALESHRRALGGEKAALSALAEQYLTGGGSLPQAPETAVSLLTQAAYGGDAQAMYLLSRCMKHQLADLKNDPALIGRLVRASASRGHAKAQKEQDGIPRERGVLPPSKVAGELARKYGAGRPCRVNAAAPGEPLPDQEAAALEDAFWMGRKARVYAAEFLSDGDGTYGLAAASDGLYGRLPGERFPFFLSWSDYAQGEVAQRETDDGHFLWLNGRKLIWRDEKLGGSMIEYLAYVKKQL